MSDMTIRDPDAMEQFASEIQAYVEAMRKACQSLKAGLDSARPLMKDRVSTKSLQRIDELAGDLIDGLPEAEEAAEKLIAAAKPLKTARTIM